MVEITSLTPEQLVLQWASQNKIGEEADTRLFEEGFTSLEAIRLLDADDLSRSKISWGQKKLLPCFRVLNGGQTIVTKTTAPREPVNNVPIKTTSSNDMSAPSPNQSAMPMSQSGD